MMPLSPAKRWLLTALGLVALAIILSHELVASPMLIKSAVSDGVDGFVCRDLFVETPGGSWSGGNHTMRAALTMPRSCLTDLRKRVEGSTQFHAEPCNLVEQCWVRVDGDATYTFTFYPEYVGFRFENH